MATSKHEDKLRELGFEPLPTTRRERRERAGNAYFTAGSTGDGRGSITYATDEVGNRWMAMDAVDLTNLGFRNNSPQARKLREAIGSIPKAH